MERDTSAPEFRLLKVAGTLTLRGLTLRSGGATGINTNLFGGGIFNTGTLALTNCSLTGNTADLGGGIFNTGTLALTNCSLTGNTNVSGIGGGGGINNQGTLDLHQLFTLADNTSPAAAVFSTRHRDVHQLYPAKLVIRGGLAMAAVAASLLYDGGSQSTTAAAHQLQLYPGRQYGHPQRRRHLERRGHRDAHQLDPD